ncbi:MAG TPA: vWA domain-containing protein [Nannocystaceae bacterium]|nr:vWA domain-containing protein [Nannocystaceae bacterium]
MGKRRAAFVGLVLLCSCKQEEGASEEETSTGTGGIVTVGNDTGPKLDLGGGADSTGGPVGCGGDASCAGVIDLLFVIDNSGSMGEEQANLARNMPLLVQQLEMLEDVDGNVIVPDVHIMVTTTDNDNPLCAPYYPAGRSAEHGAPIATACTDRIERFTSVSQPPDDQSDVCTDICPTPVAPSGNFITLSPGGDNVTDVADADVNGDGVPDDAVAQALACIGPQGIDGCGYESPLEAMRRALDPEAEWNQGGNGFLRAGGVLAVAIITDEADCSIASEGVMTDMQWQEDNPDTMMPVPSSAICWNAGMSCDGPDGNGVYDNCHSTGDALFPTDEYSALLQGLGRPVVMLGILGVPEVTAHAEEPPYQPTAGGVMDLEIRDWRDPEYPTGDILPDDWAEGRDAAHQTWVYGIGPGCTGEDGNGGFTGQAIPNVRVQEVCQALDVADDPDTPMSEAAVRCCIESICDTDFSDALRCLAGLIEENVTPQG